MSVKTAFQLPLKIKDWDPQAKLTFHRVRLPPANKDEKKDFSENQEVEAHIADVREDGVSVALKDWDPRAKLTFHRVRLPTANKDEKKEFSENQEVEEPAYMPQVKVISSMLPSEEGRCNSPTWVRIENIENNIEKFDKKINEVQSQLSKLYKKWNEIEMKGSKPVVHKEIAKDACPIKSKQMSMAHIIYSENREKSQASQTILQKLGPNVESPMYNQPSDTAVYHENKRKFRFFNTRLVKCLKMRHRKRSMRGKHLTESYSKLMEEWHKNMEKTDNGPTKRAKLIQYFEEQFPNLKKRGENKKVIRSKSECKEIINAEQEMRSCAVIPPIMVDPHQRRMCFINNNGLIKDLSREHQDLAQLNVWTDQEKQIFQDKFLQHPKNFALIASHLERKSVAACIEYYYHSKKQKNYKQLLKEERRRALRNPPRNNQQAQNDPVAQKDLTKNY